MPRTESVIRQSEPSPPRIARLALELICGIFAFMLAGCDRSSSDKTDTGRDRSQPLQTVPVSRPAAAAGGYVGSQSCAECHPEVAAAYRSHPMAHSLTEVLEEPVEDYQTGVTFESYPGCVYRVNPTESGVTHSEILSSREGEVIYDQTLPVQYAVGSGKRGRSYLINQKWVAVYVSGDLVHRRSTVRPVTRLSTGGSPSIWQARLRRMPGLSQRLDGNLQRRSPSLCSLSISGEIDRLRTVPRPRTRSHCLSRLEQRRLCLTRRSERSHRQSGQTFPATSRGCLAINVIFRGWNGYCVTAGPSLIFGQETG